MVNEEMVFFKENQKDNSKVDLEVNILKKIDVQGLFDKVVVLPLKFKYPRFSLEENVAHFNYGPREIKVSGEGRIWIRNCKDRADAQFILNEIEAML